eukprot:gene52825-63917_t
MASPAKVRLAAEAAKKMRNYHLKVTALSPVDDREWREELDRLAAGCELRCGQRRAGTWKYGQADRLKEETDAEFRTRLRFIDSCVWLLEEDANYWRKAAAADVELGRRGTMRAKDAKGAYRNREDAAGPNKDGGVVEP